VSNFLERDFWEVRGDFKSMVPSTRVELFDNAGHALFVDDSTHFNAVLEDFLQNLPSQE